MAEHEVAALQGAVAGDAGDDRIVGKRAATRSAIPMPLCSSTMGNPCRQLPDQGVRGRNDLPRLGHHQQASDGAWLVDEGALDGKELGMAVEGGEVDAGVQGGTVPLAQQDARRLAA